MYNKRRSRSRRRGYGFSQRRKGKPNYLPVIVILCLSVGCGYATAKYVVDPVVNYVPQLTAEKTQEKTEVTESTGTQQKETETSVVEDGVKVEETGKVAGYALQFGCYSGKAAAEKAMPSIDVDGLQILEQNQMYKIVGKTYETKEKAKAALEKLPDDVDAFVTTIYE